MKNKGSSTISLLKSFSYALKGLWFCISNERNFRIHSVIAVYVFAFSSFYNFNAGEYALLFIAVSTVLISEMFNTVVECVIDYLMPNRNKFAAMAKDISAGAVFICAVMSVVSGLYLFLRIDIIKNIIKYFANNIFMLILFIISIILAVLFIFVIKLKEPKFYKDIDDAV